MKKNIPLLFLFILILGCGGSDSSDMPVQDDIVQDDTSSDNESPTDDTSPPDDSDSDSDQTDNTLLSLLKSATFGTVDTDVVDRLVLDPSGNLIHLGQSAQTTTIFAVNSDFDALWDEFYNDLRLLDLRLTPDNHLIATGNTDTANSDDSDAILVKLDLTGNIIWETTVAGDLWENLQSVDFTSDGGFIAAGNTTSSTGFISQNNGNQDLIVVRFDENGDFIWANNYGGSGSEFANDVIVLPNGNFIVVGITGSNDGDIIDNDGGVEVWALLIDPNGSLISSRTIGSSGSDGGYSISSLQGGNYVIAGDNEAGDLDATENNGAEDAWIVVIDTELNILNQASFGDSELDLARNVFELPSGDFIVTGTSSSSEGIAINNKGSNDYMILRLSRSLTLKDTLLIGGRRQDFFSDAVLADKNTLWLTGSTFSNDGDISENNGGLDVWTTQIFVPDN